MAFVEKNFQKIILVGQPRSTNNLYRSHCRFKFPTVYMTAEGKALKESYQWQATVQWKNKIISENVELKIDLYFKTKRIADIDNYNKLILDALSGIVFEDDKQIQKLIITKNYDKENPRCEITIYV